MEHFVQFAISIDERTIVERVTANAEKQITQSIEQSVRNKLFDSGYYKSNADNRSPLSDYSKRIVEEFLDKNREEILEKAAAVLADRLLRSKAGKALLEQA